MKASRFAWRLQREKSIYVVPGERGFMKDVRPHLALW